MAALGKSDLMRIMARSFYIQGTWNYERMLALGYCFCLAPFARRILKNDEDVRQFLQRNLGYFNTHPYMAGWVIGAALKIEEQAGAGDVTIQRERFKKRMSQFLGAIGDKLFWGLIKPLAALIGFGLAFFYQEVGVVTFLVLHNVPHFYTRFKGVWQGYAKGFDIVKDLSLGRFNQLADWLLYAASFVATVVFMFLACSEQIGNLGQAAAFAGSAVGAGWLFRRGVSVPVTLLSILMLSLIVGGLLG